MTITLADNTTTSVSVQNGKGIASIAKTGTVDLVDTYTITYNDSTTSTFTVTNGAKGDTGDSWYVWIRYAGSEPTQDSDMGTEPDNWMGIYSGTSSTAPVHYTDYDWFQIKGEKGDQGDPASIVSQSVTYQEGTSPNIQPSGTWTTSIPTVAQGNYLWTRTIITFNSGSPVTFYSVARMGLDGTGSVTSVNNQSPDANGNVTVTASDISTTDSTSVQTEINGVKNTLTQLETDTFGNINLTGTNNTGSTITAGTFFYNNGTLVRAKVDIQNGSAITIGTNAETVTAGGLNDIIKISPVTKTYTTNSYVPSNRFSGAVYEILGKFYVYAINIQIASAMASGTTGIEIGRLALNHTPNGTSMLTLASQEGNGAILITISTSGIVSISNESGTSAGGFYRGSLIII